MPHKSPPSRIAIIGGGPGGLVSARLLHERLGDRVSLTLFEADQRLGGKLVTGTFSALPVSYEIGAAELYDYSALGPDPLRALVQQLGLETVPLAGSAVVLGGQLIEQMESLRTVAGEATWRALQRFDARARRWMSPTDYYEADDAVTDAMDRRTFASLLDEVSDETARAYLQVLVHSDLATEPRLTSAAYGLQNYLMSDPAYMRLYAIRGGMQAFANALAATVVGDVRLGTSVTHLERRVDGTYLLTTRCDGITRDEPFDQVVVALPHDALASVAWGGRRLSDAMTRHRAHYDHPAHYLRVTVLFDQPFWRDRLPGAFTMLDAFGGTCLYDESLRSPGTPGAVLGWLIAGEHAMRLSNLPDAAIIDAALATLPPLLADRQGTVLETRVHRWIGAVNGLPGGVPRVPLATRHCPEPSEHPALFLVGDYLFDATINGVLDSAEFVADAVQERLDAGRPTEPLVARVAG